MRGESNSFWALVAAVSGQEAPPVEAPRESDVTLDVTGRPVQIRLDAEGQMHVATAIYLNDNDPSNILAERIAEFNAFHLFAGGYCLRVDPKSGSIYVDQIVSPQRFDGATFRDFLIDFAHRATSCMRWYGEAF